MGEITQVLRLEHETILFVLKILDKMVQTKAAENTETLIHCTELVKFLHVFAEKSHHAKEEYLIEALKEGSFSHEENTIGAIQREHEEGHMLLIQMSNALESKDVKKFYAASKQYSALLSNSMATEGTTLYELADQVLDEDTQDELLVQFLELEKAVIGRDLYRNMHDMISTWSGAFGV